jgi:hypothetical protein
VAQTLMLYSMFFRGLLGRLFFISFYLPLMLVYRCNYTISLKYMRQTQINTEAYNHKVIAI